MGGKRVFPNGRQNQQGKLSLPVPAAISKLPNQLSPNKTKTLVSSKPQTTNLIYKPNQHIFLCIQTKHPFFLAQISAITLTTEVSFKMILTWHGQCLMIFVLTIQSSTLVFLLVLISSVFLLFILIKKWNVGALNLDWIPHILLLFLWSSLNWAPQNALVLATWMIVYTRHILLFHVSSMFSLHRQSRPRMLCT